MCSADLGFVSFGGVDLSKSRDKTRGGHPCYPAPKPLPKREPID